MEDDFIQYFDIKIHWTKETDGCSNTMVDDFIDATQAISQDKKFNNVLEWCSGPGFWGFGLLATGIANKVTLADIYEPTQLPVLQTIKENNLENTAQFILSDNFTNIPQQKFDLIVANPPHFNMDPYVAHYDDPRKYKDLDWSIHRNFFNNVNNYLTDDGIIVLAENVWGSNPDTFQDMITDNDLQITQHFVSKQYPLDMWYLGITRLHH